MDAENDNEQPNSSSNSSSNHSSNSNLLSNLPMLSMLHQEHESHEQQELDHEEQHQQQGTASATSSSANQPQISDISVNFISPLLFNNNSTPPLSSSTSSSSSTSHINILPILTNPSVSNQPHESFESSPHREPIITENITDNIATTSTSQSGNNNVNLNTDGPSTSSQHRQEEDSTQPILVSSNAESAESDSSTPSLPLLLQNEAQPNSTNPNTYSSLHYPQPFVHSHQHHRHNHQLQDLNISNDQIGGSFRNSSTMFTNNDNAPGTSSTTANHNHHSVDRLKQLYPNVNENETPLPRCWSPHDKCLSIGLSQNNLRVHYKGVGKQHNDAASVRTAYPIPPACGIYYFEVKIISKGKNGYMGIGLTAQQFRMNRLPGWDKQSYGYHGDDGNSFSSSGNGQSYGPTFTTGDIIGCCVNFINNTCFYTKNGIDLGIAFRDLPTKLYPTVGLQTPGEEVNANFGQEPFVFDQIEDMMKQMRCEIKTSIYDFPPPNDQGDPTTLLHKMVSSYLVHNGYSETAEAFAKTTCQTFEEDITSIRNRQKILKLVMSGKMSQAIELTLHSYPGLLENNKNLWFMLKCRQFIEMVNGSDLEYCPTNKLTNSATTQTQTTPPNQTSVIQSTKAYQNGNSTNTTNNAQNSIPTTINSTVINADNHHQDLKYEPNSVDISDAVDATSNKKCTENLDYINDVEMENNVQTTATNGNVCKNGNADTYDNSMDEEMDVEMSPSSPKYSNGIERILEFGKELSQMGQQLEKENKMNKKDRQMLEDAFSLIAYSNPWSSPLGWQLCPSKREAVCTALNSTILESMNYPRRPPLSTCVAHAAELLKMMAQASLGACAFVNIEDIFPQN